MQYISAPSLETDLPSRISYLSSFLDLTDADGEALHAAKPLIAPLIPAILDAVYTKLLSFDITAQAFVPRNTGYEGKVAGDVQQLTLEHPQIVLRRDFLKNYLLKLLSATNLSPASPFWVYLNNVGIMHTGAAGFKHREKKPELRVEYMHLSALLGYVVDLVISAVMDMEVDVLEGETKKRVLRAVSKVLWIQNDLFARHYVVGGVGGLSGDVGVGGGRGIVTPPEEGGELKKDLKSE